MSEIRVGSTDGSLLARKKSLLVRLIMSMALAASVALSCTHVISHVDMPSFLIAACSCSTIAGLVVFLKYDAIIGTIRKRRGIVLLSLCLAACFSYGSYALMGFGARASFFYGKVCYLLAYPSAALVFGFVSCLILIWIRDIRKHVTKNDIKICMAAEVVFISLMLLFVYTNPDWYTQYDKVYSMDSGYCVERILPNVDYYDIRHPLLSGIAFPVWATLTGFAGFVVPSQLSTAFCVGGVQLLSVQMLIAIGLMLRAVTKSSTCLVLYFAMFSTLISAVAVEKFVLSSFFIVATIYLLCFHANYAPVGYVLATGVMPTNAFLLLSEFLKKDSIGAKAQRLGSAVLLGFLALICTGHANMLNIPETLSQILSMHNDFGTGDVSLAGRFFAAMNMWQGSFLPLSAQTHNGCYIWTDLTAKIGWLTIPIILMMAIGLWVRRGQLAFKIAGLWVLFCFVLFVVLNWAPHTSVLFAPLFSWSAVILFSGGLDHLASRLSINKYAITATVASVCLMAGIAELVSINNFMLLNL